MEQQDTVAAVLGPQPQTREMDTLALLLTMTAVLAAVALGVLAL
jgi:hypothetical protein